MCAMAVGYIDINLIKRFLYDCSLSSLAQISPHPSSLFVLTGPCEQSYG